MIHCTEIMLNPFPIQFLAPLAYCILRVALGILLIRFGNRLLQKEPRSVFPTLLGWVEILMGALFIVGFYTQIVALFTIVLSIPVLVKSNTLLHAFPINRATVFLICMIAFSLFITGAGAFAIDLPI